MAEAVAPQVFTRRASGLIRVMSPYSAFVYNILTMGIIFPWVFMQAPTAFQGSNLVLAILFAFVFELPIAMAYVWLATALPRSGGDYVFQSRVFGGGFGFTVVFGFFVVWILQWVALSGWLLATVGIAPTFIGLGATTGIDAFTDIGTWAAGASGIIIISVLNAIVALVLLISGFRLRPVPVRDVVCDPALVRDRDPAVPVHEPNLGGGAPRRSPRTWTEPRTSSPPPLPRPPRRASTSIRRSG